MPGSPTSPGRRSSRLGAAILKQPLAIPLRAKRPPSASARLAGCDHDPVIDKDNVDLVARMQLRLVADSLGITTWPFAPTLVVILVEYNLLHRAVGTAPPRPEWIGGLAVASPPR